MIANYLHVSCGLERYYFVVLEAVFRREMFIYQMENYVYR